MTRSLDGDGAGGGRSGARLSRWDRAALYIGVAGLGMGHTLIAQLMLIGSAAHRFATEPAARTVRRTPANLALLALGAWALLSTIPAVDRFAAWGGAVGAALSVCVTLGVVRRAMADPDRGLGRRLVATFLVSATLGALYGLVRLGFGLAAHVPDVRVELPFVGCNATGTVLAAALVTALGCIARANGRERAALAVMVPILAAGLALTQSRGALVALIVAVSILVVLGFRTRTGRTLMVAGVALAAALAACAYLYPPVSARYANILSLAANGDRLEIWRTAIAMTRDHPVLGIGLNNFDELYLEYPHPWPPDHTMSTAHNVFLEVSATLGVPGLLLFVTVLWLGITGGLRVLRAMQRANAPPEMERLRSETAAAAWTAATTLAVFGALLAHLQVDITLYSGDMYPLFFGVYGLLVCLGEQAAAADSGKGSGAPLERAEGTERASGAVDPADLPFVSVIIPTFNRERVLEKCLRALVGQTYPLDRYEVIVVDDGSTDGTRDMVERVSAACRAERGSSPLVYRHREHTGSSAARNEGIRAARGELVVFLDSDMVVKPDFIAAHVAEHLGAPDRSRGDRLIVHGRVIYTTNPEHPTAEKRKASDVSMAFFATGNVSIARKWLVEAGMFDEDFTEYGWEDLELGRRLKKLGLRVARSDRPVGYHLKREFSAADLPAIRRREIERGHMAVLYYRKHPTFGVRMTTMLVRPFFWLVAVLAPCGWPDRPRAAALLDRLHRRGHRIVLAVLLQIMVYYWYARGMKEGLAARRGN